MDTSTTQKGVPAEGDDTQTTETQLSPRDQRMAELVEARRSEIESSVESGRAQAGGEASGDAAPPEAKPGSDPATVKLKVYGQEVELSFEEMKARAQKDVAADVRLARAAEIERAALQKQAQAEALQEQLNRELASLRKTPETVPAGQADADIDLAVEALFDNDVEGAKAQLRKAIEGRAGTTPNIEAIAAEVRNGLRQEMAATTAAQRQLAEQAELVEALNQFRTDFPEIAGDPRLFAYANAETDLVAAENPQLRPAEIMALAGQRVRAATAKSPPAPPPTRQDAKRALPRAVTGVTASVNLGEKPKPPQTTSDVIARMRQLRGQ